MISWKLGGLKHRINSIYRLPAGLHFSLFYTLIIIWILTFSLISISSAYTVYSSDIQPPGELKSNQKINVQIIVTFTDYTSGMIPKGRTLQFFTDLEHPTWNYTIFRQGQATTFKEISGNKYISIDAWDLSYQFETVKLKVDLQGDTPTTASAPIKVIQIKELDENGKVTPYVYALNRNINNAITKTPTINSFTTPTKSSFTTPTTSSFTIHTVPITPTPSPVITRNFPSVRNGFPFLSEMGSKMLVYIMKPADYPHGLMTAVLYFNPGIKLSLIFIFLMVAIRKY